MAEQHQDQVFVENVVKALVDHPEEVKTERTVDEMGVLITLHINPEDMGQVIGRSGRTARAVRTLLRVVGAKHQARVNLKIHEPEGGRPPRERRDDAPAGDAPRNDAPRNDAPKASVDTDDAGVEDLKL
jgi:uncharacterized protein